MNVMDSAMDFARKQAKATADAAQALNTCWSALLGASVEFVKSGAERNGEYSRGMAAARSLEEMTEIQATFVRAALNAYGDMATKVVEAQMLAARQCNTVMIAALHMPKSDKSA
ncbi:MAG: phasin family protein [Hyphomicrobiales bacterium]|nr:phasin family protein [Hyphomicrobiales bacterium]